MAKTRILVIEDDELTSLFIKECLVEEGHEVEIAKDGPSGLIQVKKQSWDLIFLDYIMPGMDGLEVLRAINEGKFDAAVLFMTAHATIENAVEAMKLGAADYLLKPLTPETLGLKVKTVLEMSALRRQVGLVHSTMKERHGFQNVAASGPPMDKVLNFVRTIASSEAETILLLGESGVGKNLMAQTIHYNSRRAEKPFVTVTCTALPEQLLESELFGHEKGAFTDAKKMRRGLFEMGDGGTVFLDEIGDMPLTLQAKLLGFLENRTFRRVGGSVEHHVDVRIITATNKDLKQSVEEKTFRSDLFYRLNVIEIEIPPLRDRLGDVGQIVKRFINHYNKKFGKRVSGIREDALKLLESHNWPGNVRELKNVVERAMILCGDAFLTKADFPLVKPTIVQNVQPQAQRVHLTGMNMVDHEKKLVEQALNESSGNQSKAARILGITRNQLIYRLKKFGLYSV